jgi:hypothetical protein
MPDNPGVLPPMASQVRASHVTLRMLPSEACRAPLQQRQDFNLISKKAMRVGGKRRCCAKRPVPSDLPGGCVRRALCDVAVVAVVVVVVGVLANRVGRWD